MSTQIGSTLPTTALQWARTGQCVTALHVAERVEGTATGEALFIVCTVAIFSAAWLILSIFAPIAVVPLSARRERAFIVSTCLTFIAIVVAQALDTLAAARITDRVFTLLVSAQVSTFAGL